MIALESSMSRAAGTSRTSVNLRFAGGRCAFEEVEVATGIGLGNVTLVERAVAALVAWLGSLPGSAATRELRVAHLELETALGHVKLDQIAVAHEGERAAHERLGRDVEH